jgi:ATP-dependent exoDNAse (exonuclease V) alpha subunit
MPMSPTDSDLPFKLKRLQFPVLLAFAMTIDKSQGQTLKKVGIYLPKPVFSHGQQPV